MKLLSLLSATAARRDLSDALHLSPAQRADLESNPDRFIDEHFRDECSGETRALLGGGPSLREAFKSITPIEIALSIVVLSPATIAFMSVVP